VITIDARDADEVGNCQACGDGTHHVMVTIEFKPTKVLKGHVVNLCYTCVRLLRETLTEKNVK